MRMKKKITALLSALCLIIMTVSFPCAVLAEDESQAESSGTTMTLTGELEDEVTVGADVKHLILAGVTQSSEGEINCKGNVEVEIQDGTENTVGIIAGSYSIRFIGGGNLNTTSLMAFGGMMVFDHTGVVTIASGSVLSVGGSIYINSGTIKVAASETDGFAIFSVDGSVEINGGTVECSGYAAGVYANESIALDGGSVTAEASLGAAFSAGSDDGGSLTISEAMQESAGIKAAQVEASDGSMVYSVVNEDGDCVSAAAMEGPPDEARIAEVDAMFADVLTEDISDVSDTEETSEEETEEESSETVSGSSAEETESTAVSETTQTPTPEAAKKSGQGNIAVIIILIVVIGAAAAAAVLAVKQSKKGKKKNKK